MMGIQKIVQLVLSLVIVINMNATTVSGIQIRGKDAREEQRRKLHTRTQPAGLQRMAAEPQLAAREPRAPQPKKGDTSGARRQASGVVARRRDQRKRNEKTLRESAVPQPQLAPVHESQPAPVRSKPAAEQSKLAPTVTPKASKNTFTAEALRAKKAPKSKAVKMYMNKLVEDSVIKSPTMKPVMEEDLFEQEASMAVYNAVSASEFKKFGDEYMARKSAHNEIL
jgi:hypothetical protein